MLEETWAARPLEAGPPFAFTAGISPRALVVSDALGRHEWRRTSYRIVLDGHDSVWAAGSS